MLYALNAVLLIAAAFLVALAVLVVYGAIDKRRVSHLRVASQDQRDAAVFVFDDENLLDATPAGHRFLDSSEQTGTAWSRFAGLLAPQFPNLTDGMGDLADLGSLSLLSIDGARRIRAEWHDGVARISLEAADDIADPAELDGHSLMAMAQELDALRANASHTPYPLWRETAQGVVTWCNAAYLDLADSIGGLGAETAWPPAAIFDLPEPIEPGESQTRRVAVSVPGQETRHWFEVTASALDTGDRFCAAVPADTLVRAESALEEFVTTLTKTFASLPVGLAIFDRSRRLAVFNPALMDLTLLPADFLISKPSFSAFLDRLRDARMIPEPKDYRSWRQQMSDLEAAAQNGTYEETWALPTGQTYKVMGRPHPDGAVALLFEDISDEITVTRRFRAELETGQAVLDALPQGVAVFTPGGVLSMSNAAYATIWGNDPSTSLGDITLVDAIARWRTLSAPTPVWDRLRAYVAQASPREPWGAQVTLLNGQCLSCEVSPLGRGATMVRFSVVAHEVTPAVASDTAPAPAHALAKAEA